jgi:hypothetical protein
MNTSHQAELRKGQMRFWAPALAVLALGVIMIVCLQFFLKADVHSLLWVRLLGLGVAIMGASRGSAPVKYMLVFLVMVGFAIDYGAAQGSYWHVGLTIIAFLDLVAGIAFCYFALLDNKVNAWLLHQHWRNYGQTGEKVAKSPKESSNEESYRKPEKDELGVFEED